MLITGVLQRWRLEREAGDLTFEDLARRLEDSRKSVEARLRAAIDSPRNRKQIAHIVGIERWGQQRLRSQLGEPLVMDGYEGYRPDRDGSFEDLCAEFTRSRSDTLALLRRLDQSGYPPIRTVPHNEAGSITLRAWFLYLDTHAERESARIKLAPRRDVYPRSGAA